MVHLLEIRVVQWSSLVFRCHVWLPRTQSVIDIDAHGHRRFSTYWNISQMSYYNASPNSDSTKHIGTYQYWNTIISPIMSYWNTIVHCNIIVLVMCYLYNTKKVHYYNITNYVYVILEPDWLVLTSPNATSACVLVFMGQFRTMSGIHRPKYIWLWRT